MKQKKFLKWIVSRGSKVEKLNSWMKQKKDLPSDCSQILLSFIDVPVIKS